MGFFSQAMNQLTGDAKYMDEFERALYNNVLAGVAASGRQYTYQNPLNTDRSERWEWHPLPLLPPMFLKIVSATPEFIYARDDRTVYVNLFIGSDADIALGDTQVHVRQQTRYPVDGKVVLTLTPEKAARFTVKVRIPGWARGEENPFGLYVSESPAAPGALGERHPGRNPPRQRVRPPRPGLEPRRPHRAGTSRRAAPRPGT